MTRKIRRTGSRRKERKTRNRRARKTEARRRVQQARNARNYQKEASYVDGLHQAERRLYQGKARTHISSYELKQKYPNIPEEVLYDILEDAENFFNQYPVEDENELDDDEYQEYTNCPFCKTEIMLKKETVRDVLDKTKSKKPFGKEVNASDVMLDKGKSEPYKPNPRGKDPKVGEGKDNKGNVNLPETQEPYDRDTNELATSQVNYSTDTSYASSTASTTPTLSQLLS